QKREALATICSQLEKTAASVRDDPTKLPTMPDCHLDQLAPMPKWHTGRELPLKVTVTFDGLGTFSYDSGESNWIGSGSGCAITDLSIAFAKPQESLTLGGEAVFEQHAVKTELRDPIPWIRGIPPDPNA